MTEKLIRVLALSICINPLLSYFAVFCYRKSQLGLELVHVLRHATCEVLKPFVNRSRPLRDAVAMET